MSGATPTRGIGATEAPGANSCGIEAETQSSLPPRAAALGDESPALSAAPRSAAAHDSAAVGGSVGASPRGSVVASPRAPSGAHSSAAVAAAAAALAIEANEETRAKVSRLERELDVAEATREREVSACARSAAEQVQQLSAAIMKADRMLAEVTIENERLSVELEHSTSSHNEQMSALVRRVRDAEAEAKHVQAASLSLEQQLRNDLSEAQRVALQEVRDVTERAEQATARAHAAEADAAAAAALRGAYVGDGSSYNAAHPASAPPSPFPMQGHARDLDTTSAPPSNASSPGARTSGAADAAAARLSEAKSARKVRYANEQRDKFEAELRRKTAAMERCGRDPIEPSCTSLLHPPPAPPSCTPSCTPLISSPSPPSPSPPPLQVQGAARGQVRR